MTVEYNKTDTIKVSTLKESPVQIRLHTDKFIEEMAKELKKKSKAKEDIQPICVANLDGETYIVDGHARVLACKQAGITEIPAQTIEVSSLVDIVTEHVRRNMNSHVDPIKVFDAVAYLEKSGIGYDEAVSALRLSIPFVNAVTNQKRISPEALDLLREFIEKRLKKEQNTPYVAPHVFRFIARYSNAESQKWFVEKLVEYLERLIQQKKFSVPSISEMENLVQEFGKDPSEIEAEKERVKKGIVVFQEVDGKRNSSSGTVILHDDNEPKIVEIEDPDPEETKRERELYQRAEDILPNIPYHALLSCKNCGTDYAVDMKNEVFAPIKETESVISTQGDESEQLYSLPKRYVRFLEPESRTIKFFEFNSIDELKKLKEVPAKSGTRYLVIVAE